MTPEEVIKRVDENTIGVMPTFGVTFTCQYEPVAEVAAALDTLARDKKLDIPMHVDAASGGFTAPFMSQTLSGISYSARPVDQCVRPQIRIGSSRGGMGGVARPDRLAGGTDLLCELSGRQHADLALIFSRPGGQIISQYYLFLRLGREGYLRILKNSYDNAKLIGREICKLGPFQLAFDGDSRKGIPAISWMIKDRAQPGYSLFELSDRLRVRGWQVAAYRMLPNITDVVVMRVLIRHGFTGIWPTCWCRTSSDRSII